MKETFVHIFIVCVALLWNEQIIRFRLHDIMCRLYICFMEWKTDKQKTLAIWTTNVYTLNTISTSIQTFINIYELKYDFIVANQTIAIDLRSVCEHIYNRIWRCNIAFQFFLTESSEFATDSIVEHAQLYEHWTLHNGTIQYTLQNWFITNRIYMQHSSFHTHNFPRRNEVETRAFKM